MLTFLAASIPLLTIQIDYVVQYTKPNIPKMPANAYVAGYIVLVTVQYMWVLVIGSDKSTMLGKLGHMSSDSEDVPSSNNGFEPEFYSEKMLQSIPSSTIMGVHGGASTRTHHSKKTTCSISHLQEFLYIICFF